MNQKRHILPLKEWSTIAPASCDRTVHVTEYVLYGHMDRMPGWMLFACGLVVGGLAAWVFWYV